jgi:hypothetical protein
MQGSVNVETILYAEVDDIRVSGPGTVTSGGGFVGGGFGVESAMQGIAVATLLNLVTTTSKVHTYITLSSIRGELHFHYAGMEPGAVTVALAPVFTSLRRMNPRWIDIQVARIDGCKKAGIITEGEYAQMLLMLVDPPGHVQVGAHTRARKAAQLAAKERQIAGTRNAESAVKKRELDQARNTPTPGKQVDITFFGKKI